MFYCLSFCAQREQETRGEAWRCLVGPELLGTRQRVAGGKAGSQRLGIDL